MRRFKALDFQGYPVPYAHDRGADTPGRFESSAHRHFPQHDASAAWVPRRSAHDFQGRPTPYALDGRLADTPDRYVSAAHRQFRDRTSHAAQVERRQAFDFSGKPVPFATDEDDHGGVDDGGVDSNGRYVSATQRLYRARQGGDGRPPERARAPRQHGRPFATDDGGGRGEYGEGQSLRTPAGVGSAEPSSRLSGGAGEWSTEHRAHFVTKDLLAARPRRRERFDGGFNP